MKARIKNLTKDDSKKGYRIDDIIDVIDVNGMYEDTEGWAWTHAELELIEDQPTDTHYNNENGSLYLFAEQHSLNAWEFDIIKRITRCRKKGQFIEDLEKTKRVIDLYIKEYDTTANR